MQPFQERVVQEKAELDEKIVKLKAFLETDTFKSLSVKEIDRLNRQFRAMCEYSSILGDRIAAFV